MLTVTFGAYAIPVGTIVHKVAGQKKYVLKNKIDIHGSMEREIIADSGTMFLVSEDSIHCIPSLTPLSIDFENNEEAIEFLETQLDERAT